MWRKGLSFVLADIPGIIEGAAEGAGLGHDFLRHIDRCRLLVHVVDVSGSEGRDPVEDFDAINAELSQYSPDLATRPQIVVANKTDIMEDESLLEKLRAHVEPLGYPLFALSAASHTGTRELVLKIAEKLSTLPARHGLRARVRSQAREDRRERAAQHHRRGQHLHCRGQVA